MGNKLEVVLTPALLPFHQVKDKVVVVIDILRATTSICVAFKTGVTRILPVATPEEAQVFKDFDFVTAAERNAKKLDGFDLGNSPFEFENNLLKDRSIAITTTNGTKAIKLSKEAGASAILIGSFLNITALSQYLEKLNNKSVILLCAGWKDKFNLEDTLFAGALVNRLENVFEIDCDAALASKNLFEMAKDQLIDFVRKSSHAKRFGDHQSQFDDVAYCMQLDTVNLVPELKGEYIIADRQTLTAGI